MRLRVSIPLNNFWIVLTDFHEIWYGHHATRECSICVRNLFTIFNTNIIATRKCEIGTTFMPLNINFILA
jgi:hypothetical protein